MRDRIERAVADAALDGAYDATRRQFFEKAAPTPGEADLPTVDRSASTERVSADLSADLGPDVVLTFDDPEYLSFMGAELRRLDAHGLLDGLAKITDDPDEFEGHVDQDLKDRASGLYHTGTVELFVAPDEVIGETPRSRKTRRGYFATNSNYGSIWHELGHHVIREENPGMTFGPGDDEDHWGQRIVADNAELIGHEVSLYATAGGMEFIAEVFSGLMSGETYPQAIMDLHDELHGPIPPPGAVDPGTDFEVGLIEDGQAPTAVSRAAAAAAVKERSLAQSDGFEYIAPGSNVPDALESATEDGVFDDGAITVDTTPVGDLGTWGEPGVPIAADPEGFGYLGSTVRMPLDDFRRLQEYIGITLADYDTDREEFWSAVSDNVADKYARILTGEDPPGKYHDGMAMPWVEIGKNGTLRYSQEGRHRVVAAERAGLDTIPVRIVYNTSQSGEGGVEAQEVSSEAHRVVRALERNDFAEIEAKPLGSMTAIDFRVPALHPGTARRAIKSSLILDGDGGVDVFTLRFPIVYTDDIPVATLNDALQFASDEILVETEIRIEGAQGIENAHIESAEGADLPDDPVGLANQLGHAMDTFYDVLGEVETMIGHAAERGAMSGIGAEIDAAIARGIYAREGDSFDTKEAAEGRAAELDCSGAHQMSDGRWMPCDSHEEYESASMRYGAVDPQRNGREINDREFRIVIPKFDNSGRPIRPDVVEDIAVEISERFGGVTVFPSVAGCWSPDDGDLICEENAIITTVRDSADGVPAVDDVEWIHGIGEQVADDLGQFAVFTSEDVVEVDFIEGEGRDELDESKTGRDVFRSLF